MKLDCELAVATRLAYKAAAGLRRHQAALLEVSHKAHGEVVTAAALESNALIRAGLAAVFPDDAVFSEETADSPVRLSRTRVWIVDPLDSTSSFITHGDEYSVSIGLSVDGRAVLGVVCNPVRDELFAGYQGRGVTLNGIRVRVSDATHLDQSRRTVSRKDWLRGLDGLADTLPIILPVASIAYKPARVAAGVDDGTFTLVPRKEWCTCAGVALVLAAGGRAT